MPTWVTSTIRATKDENVHEQQLFCLFLKHGQIWQSYSGSSSGANVIYHLACRQEFLEEHVHNEGP